MKEEALEVLKNRRSIRKFKPQQISQEELDAVLSAGTYAPTANGQQSPVIVAIQNPEFVAKVDAMNAKVLGNQSHPYYGAPTVLIVLAPTDSICPDIDAALVGGNLLNAAYAVGLGSCWIHRAEEMFESKEGKDLLKEWGVPDNLKGVCSIALGYMEGNMPSPAPRKEGAVA